MEKCRLKRESMLSTGKLDKIVPGLQENKSHLQKVNQCVFVEKTALQNSFMKQELVLYINDSRKSEDITNVFKLCDLVDLYTFCNQNIEQLGLTENKVHNTRLKEQLTYVHDLHAYKQGCKMYLAFNQDIGPAITKAINNISSC